MRFKRQTIAANSYLRGAEHVAAYVCSPVAYHRTLGGRTWTVTHVPSGYAVRVGLDTAAVARELANLVQPLLPTVGVFGVAPPIEEYGEAVSVVHQWFVECRQGRGSLTAVTEDDPTTDDDQEQGDDPTGWSAVADERVRETS